MEELEIIKAASKGVLPEEELSCPERCLFYAMTDLYRKYADGKISKAAGEKLKNKLLQQFRRDKDKEAWNAKLIRHQAELWKAIELTGSAYAKEPTIEHADAFYQAVYNVPRKPKKDEEE